MGEHGVQDPQQEGPFSGAAGWNALSTLISGLILGVGAGWGLSRWTGTDLMYLFGILAGTALAVYSIWARYVRR